MSVAMQIKESETGLVRLFALDLPPREALALQDTPDAIAKMLGVSGLDMTHVEIFDIADLAGLGLEAYLADGHGIAADDLAAHRWQLDAVEGPALVLRSSAITTRPATLTPQAPLRWLATFGEMRADPAIAPLRSESAKGTLGETAKTQPGRGSLWILLAAGLLAAAILAALMLAF